MEKKHCLICGKITDGTQYVVSSGNFIDLCERHGIEFVEARKIRTLEQIVQDMQRLAGPLDQVSPPDEGSHLDADALLIEALQWVKWSYGHDSAINDLIEAYEHIGKWYA